MIDSITRITLNLQETNTMVSIRAKRGDTGRKLLIHLSDGSIPYHISDDCYATFTAKKPDGTKINNPCTIENNVIEYEFTDQTCTAVGTMKAEIRLYGADDKMITSACFLVNVYDTVFRDGDEVGSETEMNTLDDLILRANAFLKETGKLLRWQGNWDSETEYEANDLVLHEEVLYVAEEAITAGTAPGSEEVTAWVPIAGMGTGSGADLTEQVDRAEAAAQNAESAAATANNARAQAQAAANSAGVYVGNAVAAMNNANAAAATAEAAKESVSTSVNLAGGYASTAHSSANQAEQAKNSAQGYANSASSSATRAEEAAARAEEAAAEAGNGSGGNAEDGFSPIATVEQTATGAIVSITDKTGTTTATITNGKDGAEGKSAYQYAKEAGYTGTEAEFAEKLADNTPAVDSGAVNELIDTKLHSVTTYGAKGDGVTDDTAAFQTALAENRVVKVPGGTYKLSDTLVIRENCCLELSQDAILRFMQATGNCIEMRGSATLRGNHGNIDVSGSFTGNVISVDTGLDGVIHASIPPYEKSTPMWKRQRFIYDVNITRTEGGFQGSLTGGHSGAALYISANYETTEEYDGSNTAPITYIWAMSVSGLRIAGAFDYGINIQNRDTTGSGYGNSADPAWNHDMRIEAVIVGCETGVRVFNCNTAHLAVTVQPGCSINKVDGANVKYAKNGIILEHSKHIDLSQSIVWDWNSSNTLVDSNAKNAHVALIGDCKGVILSDFLYNESTTDIRDLIYTDTPGNFDSLVIVQEPFTRWFKPVDGEPYFFDGNGNKRLAYKEEIDEYFQTDRVPGFINVLKTAIDTDGSIYNGTGTASGYYNSNFTSLTDGAAGAYHIHTGFIPCKKGDTFITDGIGLRDDGCVRIAVFDSDFNYLFHSNGGNMIAGSYQFASVITENGFRLTINPHDDATINKIAYARFNFNVLDLGENPVMSLNDEIKFTQEGFLADGIKVKAENVVGAVGGGATPDWNAAEGQPGHILNRTHYDYVGKVVEEVTINAASFDTVITAAHPIVVGETYTVHWGEDTYICEAWDGSVINPDAAGMLGLGDYGAWMGAPVTGEPFLIVFTGNSGQVIGIGEDMEIPFSIDGSIAVKIPDKYLPDTMKYALLEITEEEFATATSSNDFTITLNRNISHYVSIFENGGTVLVKIPFDEGISISPVVCCIKLQGGSIQAFFVRAFNGMTVKEYFIRIAVE